jgi:hypothetical protein
MKQLNSNWITEGLLDFEYKKYLLLAYLQEVSNGFNESKLYPFLSDLVNHYHNLVSIKEQKQQVVNQFPKKLSKLDLQNFKMHYESIISDAEYMEVIEEIVDYSIPMIKNHLQQGSELYDFVETKMKLFPVGLQPLNNFEGYLFVRTNPRKATKIYEYTVTIFENVNEKYRGIKTRFITDYKSSVANSYEQIKVDLIRNFKNFPNPATFAVETEYEFPLIETILPVAKRVLVKTVSTDSHK